MTRQPKKFDCVQMKNSIQAKMMEEYESRKGEFDSYADYIKTSVREHEWSRKQLERLKKTPAPA